MNDDVWEMSNTELVKAAYQIAYDGYMEFIGVQADKNVTIGQATPAIATMAAEIYRQLTRFVLVTVNSDLRGDLHPVEQLMELLGSAGCRGIITVGDVTYKFPDNEQIEIAVDRMDEKAAEETIPRRETTITMEEDDERTESES